MNIKEMTIIAAAFAVLPTFTMAQYYGERVPGREGAIMESGIFLFNMIKDLKEGNQENNKLDQKLEDLKDKTEAEYRSERQTSLRGEALLKQLRKEENDRRWKEYQEKRDKKISYKKFIEEQVAKIPAEQKARYDAMAQAEDYSGLIEELQKFRYNANPKFDYDADRYYILQAVVKVNGKGLVSFGTLDIAQTIKATTDKVRSWAYKEAEKVENSILNSGRAL